MAELKFGPTYTQGDTPSAPGGRRPCGSCPWDICPLDFEPADRPPAADGGAYPRAGAGRRGSDDDPSRGRVMGAEAVPLVHESLRKSVRATSTFSQSAFRTAGQFLSARSSVFHE